MDIPSFPIGSQARQTGGPPTIDIITAHSGLLPAAFLAYSIITELLVSRGGLTSTQGCHGPPAAVPLCDGRRSSRVDVVPFP